MITPTSMSRFQRMGRLRLGAPLISVLAFFPQNANSQIPTWEMKPVQSLDLATQPLHLEDSWAGGQLRVRVIGDPKLPPDWQIRVEYEDGGIIELNGSNIGERSVGSNDDRQINLDLPVPSAGLVRVRTNVPGLKVPVMGVLVPSLITSQQMIPGGRIDLFDKDVGPEERRVGDRFGRIDLLARDRQTILGTCTGFRIETGYWLTAGHCVAGDAKYPRQTPVAYWRVQPFDYAGVLEKTAPLAATPLATGQTGGDPDPARYLDPGELDDALHLKAGDLDYALLSVPGDGPGSGSFSMHAVSTPASGTALELFEHWPGLPKPAPGKARSADDNCVLGDPMAGDYCPGMIQHRCSSAPGASGGALVLRSTFALVGLHYRAGQDGVYNCAIPMKAIQLHLCANKPAIAAKVTSC